MKNKHAFSLVELSIVLVILGLLVGGVLAGQSLIRAAELRSVGTEFTRWHTSIYAFRDKYFALPGDMTNAQSFWGIAAACPGTNAQPSTTPATCNGNGNIIFESAPSGATGNEYFRLWQHLANAGLIEGSYAGVQGSGGVNHAVAGFNAPASKINGGCWTLGYTTAIASNANYYDVPAGNQWLFGNENSSGSCKNGILVPAELWGIDKKMDDGKPGTGKIRARNYVDCTNSANGSDVNGDYLLTGTTLCSLQMPASF